MSNPTEPTVILINRSLPYNCVGKLTGQSNAEYGHSIYEEAYAAHVCRMTIDQWRACKRDVTTGFHRRWQQWEVDFELPESPVSGEDVIARIRNADADQLDGIVPSLSPIVQAVLERVKVLYRPYDAICAPATEVPPDPEKPPAPPVTVAVVADDLPAKWFSLVKIAKTEGIDSDNYQGVAALQAAIREKRAGSGVVSTNEPSDKTADGAPTVKRMFDIPDPVPPQPPAFQGGNAS